MSATLVVDPKKYARLANRIVVKATHLGRFVCGEESPLKPWFGQSYPMLTSARDFLNDRLFRVVRNGFAHWAFDWEVVGHES